MPRPSCSPNRVARDPAGFAVPPLPSCSPNRVARDPAGFAVPSLPSCRHATMPHGPCHALRWFRCATTGVMLAQSRRTRPCGFRCATASIYWLRKIVARCTPAKPATCPIDSQSDAEDADRLAAHAGRAQDSLCCWASVRGPSVSRARCQFSPPSRGQSSRPIRKALYSPKIIENIC